MLSIEERCGNGSKRTLSSGLLNTLGNLSAERLGEADVALLEDSVEKLRCKLAAVTDSTCSSLTIASSSAVHFGILTVEDADLFACLADTTWHMVVRSLTNICEVIVVVEMDTAR